MRINFFPQRFGRSGSWLLLLFLLGALAVSLSAQTTISTGSIQGAVTDPTGALVGGAKVTITNKATGQTINLTTNSAGEYNSGSLTPGDYKVQVAAKGFSSVSLSATVQVGNTSSGNVKLQVGQESQVIEVRASEMQVNTEQATVQGVLTATQIENLPVNGRNFLDLAQLEPGVQIQDGTNFDPTKTGYSSISFGGRFGRTARIEVDGVDVSDETVGTSTQDIPASAIAEFQISQSSMDLSTELSSSGAVNVVTRTGTNTWHGEGFYFFRDNRAAASLPTPAGLKAPFQRHQYGGRVGGPVMKDKLFFFLDGEKTLQHLQAPVAEPDPFKLFSGTFPAPFKDGETLARLDYQLSKNTRLFYRNSYFQNSTFATFFPSSFQVFNNKDVSRQNLVGAEITSGSFTHSVRFSYLKFQNQIVDATRGAGLPLADFPVSINIGPLSTGPNLLAPQSTPQANTQVKYDGSKVWGRHILRYGVSFNHIQGGGFASFFKITPNDFGDPSALGCEVLDPDTCPAGPDGTVESNPLNYANLVTILGNGQGFSTEHPAIGFPAGGLGPDNRVGLYFGDSWKVRPNFTLTAGLRWVRDTGRTDSDLGAIPEINDVFPGFGNPVRQANRNFAPQLGIAWDPRSNGKTVIRAGIGLFYDNVIFNNVLFDRPPRLRSGAFLSFPQACLFGSERPVAVPKTPANPNGTIQLDPGTCSETIGQSAAAIAAFQAEYQADTPFDLKADNPNFVGTSLSQGLNLPLGLFAPNYRTPRSLQMNIGIQREIRPGMVLSADYVRNVTTHTLLGIDINHSGDASHFHLPEAQAAIATTLANCGVATIDGSINGLCPKDPANGTTDDETWVRRAATMADYAGNGLGSQADFGGACACAFGGINPSVGSAPFLFPVGRSVYNGLQMKLAQNVTNPLKGIKAINFQISYALSRFVNPMAFQGNTAPSNPVGASDQDFVLSAGDNNKPLRFMGPSLLDRTHQISFGGTIDVPFGFRFGVISHFYSPLSSPAVVGNTGASGDIFRTDFTGDGSTSDPLPGTTNGSFGRDFGVSGLNSAINNYNSTVANTPTPAGQVLVANNLFTTDQLVALGGVAPTLTAAASDQVPFKWLRAFDFKLSWTHTFHEKLTLEPSVGFFNLFNFANFDLPPGAMTGWLNSGGGSINSTNKANDFRVGQGTGVFGLGAPRVVEFGMRFTF
ncbi:MAG TPA: carboxypeptidase regulatory-like domain-containing protein [Terriglobales bacterium]|nr:carboxypeptidase regulatory-like domain-containing protein [Terriglobales bacterium]